MIDLQNIYFAYDDDFIIHGLSMHVPKGSWLGLIGPNGAGKTTLLKLIGGALVPNAGPRTPERRNPGTIKIAGRDLASYSRRELAQILAVVPQHNLFAFSFSALEVVLMGRYPYLKRFGFETRLDTEIAKEAMISTDTWQFRDRPIDELSGGERQRVLIARALAEEPKILLLDEPTTFLDIKHQKDIMEIIRALNRTNGLTIVSAIHDINLAISYCSEIAFLFDGRIYKHGDPVDVITYTNLKEIFGAEVYVGINEFTKKPYYVPMVVT